MTKREIVTQAIFEAMSGGKVLWVEVKDNPQLVVFWSRAADAAISALRPDVEGTSEVIYDVLGQKKTKLRDWSPKVQKFWDDCAQAAITHIFGEGE